jgi:hypothetical protein
MAVAMRMALFLVLVLAGCASTPNGVRESKISETVVRPGKLWDAAFCVKSGFDERIRTLNTLRINETSGWAEMVGKNHDHSELLDGSPRSGALYVVDFKALASGTQVTYHVRSDVPAREAVQDRIREILNSCE